MRDDSPSPLGCVVALVVALVIVVLVAVAGLLWRAAR